MEEIMEQEQILEQTAEQTAAQQVKVSLRGRTEEIFSNLWASLFYSQRVAGKTVMVCSSDNGEGASTIACGLALAGSLPCGADRVALVDFNLRSPDLHNILSLDRSLGVGQVLLEGMDPQIVVQNVKEGLDVFATGVLGGKGPDIFRGDSMSRFMEYLTGKYDQVIVDVASVNHYPDAQVLAGTIKDVIVVAHSEYTPREAVAQARKRLEAGGGRVVGIVLNMRTYPIPRFLYRRV